MKMQSARMLLSETEQSLRYTGEWPAKFKEGYVC